MRRFFLLVIIFLTLESVSTLLLSKKINDHHDDHHHSLTLLYFSYKKITYSQLFYRITLSRKFFRIPMKASVVDSFFRWFLSFWWIPFFIFKRWDRLWNFYIFCIFHQLVMEYFLSSSGEYFGRNGCKMKNASIRKINQLKPNYSVLLQLKQLPRQHSIHQVICFLFFFN